MRIFVLSLVAVALFASAAIAGDCCSQPACCDKSCGIQAACKVVCGVKKVEKHVWVVECVPICVANPGCERSCFGGGCEDASGCGCGECGPCAELLGRKMVKPKCGKVRYRKKLVKKTVVCEVPIYKCVVAACGSGCGCDDYKSAVPPKEEKSAIKAAPLPPLSTVLTQAE